MKRILHLAANLLRENQITLFINRDLDIHSTGLIFLVSNVIPENDIIKSSFSVKASFFCSHFLHNPCHLITVTHTHLDICSPHFID